MIWLLEIVGVWVLLMLAFSIVTWRLRWAVLVHPDLLPPVLLTRHIDWPLPFRWVQRRWLAWLGGLPKKMWGNADGHLDITAPGTWAFCWPAFVTLRTRGGWHARAGLRYDYNDAYYQLSATAKKP